MKTRIIIVAAPSGAGKSSFVERACREDSRLVDTVTYTTRSMRKGESEGHPYHFVSKEQFQAMIDDNQFVEWAEVHGNLYGTPYNQLHDAWVQGKCIIMDVDIQGAETFKAKYVDAIGIFILPPSIDEFRRRFEKREGGNPKDI
jgi:guanylate kinase